MIASASDPGRGRADTDAAAEALGAVGDPDDVRLLRAGRSGEIRVEP